MGPMSMELDGEREEEDVQLQRKRKEHKVKEENVSSDDEANEEQEDELVAEMDVKVASRLSGRTDAFMIQFPARKTGVFEDRKDGSGLLIPIARYKKHVKLLEMRLSPNPQSASYDKDKANLLMPANATNPNIKSDPYSKNSSKDDVYEGRAFQTHEHVINAFGCIKDGSFLIYPLSGSVEMRKSLSHLNQKKTSSKAGIKEETLMSDESDTEAAQQPSTSTDPGGQTVRVKFSKPESERQKKKREASALHREKLIASDAWIDMPVLSIDNPLRTDR